jgi:hypothetical protein
MLSARQSNRLTAYENVETELTRDPDVYKDDEGMQEIATELTAHLTVLKPLRKEGVRNAKGNSEEKTEAKQLLADIGAEVAGDLYSYGTKIKSRTLQAEADYSAGDLINLRGTRLVDVAEHILDVATERAGEMKKLAISEARRTELRTAIDAFSGKKNLGRQAVGAGQSVRLTTGGHFAAIAELLKDRLQRALRKYKRLNFDFYTRVNSAREVLDLPGSHESPPAAPQA